MIPLLEQHNPNLKEVLGRTSQVIAADHALLREMAQQAWAKVVREEQIPSQTPSEPGQEPEGGRIVLDLAGWRALPVALERAILREAIHRLRWSLRNINFRHVEDAVQVARGGTSGDQATLPRGLMLTMGYDRLTIASAGAAEPLPDWPLLAPAVGPVPVRVPGATSLPGSTWMLQADRIDLGELPAGWEENADPWLAFADASALGPAPVLRTRLAGDRFQPLGLHGRSAKLADFMTNQKVPSAARSRLPLLVGREAIVWVCGQRLDERARISDATEQVVVLRLVET